MPETACLRAPSRADLPFVRALWADPETMARVGRTAAITEEGGERSFRRMVDAGAPTDRCFLVEDARGRLVGEISFHRRDAARSTAGLNVKIRASGRNEGLGHAAMESFLRWSFEDFGGEEITDDLRLETEGGRHLMQDFGFVHDRSVPGGHFMRLTRVGWAQQRPPGGRGPRGRDDAGPSSP